MRTMAPAATLICLIFAPLVAQTVQSPRSAEKLETKERQRRYAVVGFKTLYGPAHPENHWLGQAFAESLTSKLASVRSHLQAISRIDLREVLAARNLSLPRVVDSTESAATLVKMARSGLLLGANLLILGSVQLDGSYRDPTTTLTVAARVIDVSTGAIIGGTSIVRIVGSEDGRRIGAFQASAVEAWAVLGRAQAAPT